MFHEEKKVFIEEIKTRNENIENGLLFFEKYNFEHLSELKYRLSNNSIKKIIFVGMGSSLYAGRVLANTISNNGIFSIAMDASEFQEIHMNNIGQDTLLVILSQSGTSQEVINLVENKKNISNCIFITNNLESEITSKAEITLPISSFQEYYAAHNSYINTIVVGEIVFEYLFGKDPSVKIQQFRNLCNALNKLDSALEAQKSTIKKIIKNVKNVDILADNLLIGVAQNSGLLFRENVGLMSSSFSAYEYLHGEHLVLSDNKLTIVLNVQDQDLLDGIIENENEYSNYLIYIGENQIKEELSQILIDESSLAIGSMVAINQIVAWGMEEI